MGKKNKHKKEDNNFGEWEIVLVEDYILSQSLIGSVNGKEEYLDQLTMELTGENVTDSKLESIRIEFSHDHLLSQPVYSVTSVSCKLHMHSFNALVDMADSGTGKYADRSLYVIYSSESSEIHFTLADPDMSIEKILSAQKINKISVQPALSTSVSS